jgi:hypothetical protein
MFSFEGFSCSLDVLYGGLGIRKLQFFDQKMREKNFQLHFFLQFLVIKALDPDPDSLEMLDPDQDSLEMLDPDPDALEMLDPD